jgi:hypothetical protein
LGAGEQPLLLPALFARPDMEGLGPSSSRLPLAGDILAKMVNLKIYQFLTEYG